MNSKRIRLGRLAPPCAYIILRPPVLLAGLVAIEPQLSKARDLDGFCIDPPIHEVEVMAGFVNHESAGVLLLTMPSAEVVGAVDGV